MTVAINEHYVVDKRGNPTGVIPDIEVYRNILAELEELAAIRAYDAAKASDDQAIPFEQAIEEIERTRQYWVDRKPDLGYSDVSDGQRKEVSLAPNQQLFE